MHRRRPEPTASAQLTGPLRALLIADSVITGLGYGFGPPEWHSSPAFAVIEQFGVPWLAWGLLYITGGILLAATRSPYQVMVGHGFLALVYLLWGLGTMATGFVGQLTTWGNPIHVMIISGIHLLALWRARKAAAVARAG